MAGSSSYRFGVLARIVRHMRARHQEGDDHPLTLDEVLDETNQLDVGNKVKQVDNFSFSRRHLKKKVNIIRKNHSL